MKPVSAFAGLSIVVAQCHLLKLRYVRGFEWRMFEWIEQNWILSFVILWLLGTWVLALVLTGRRRRHGGPVVGPISKFLGAGSYVRLEYQVPARSGRTLQKVVHNNAEIRSQYLRSAFFLLHGASFRPHGLLNEWFTSTHWKDQRELYVMDQIKSIEASIKAIRRNQIDEIYKAHDASLRRPLALSYPLMPRQFSLFFPASVSFRGETQKTNLPAGMYRCEVMHWSEENSYAENIQLQSVTGDLYRLDQQAVLACLRKRKAAIESISFMGLPIFIFAGRKRKLPKLLKEQSLKGRMPVRPGSARDFNYLDRKLIKVFGGANPANLLRMSWFYDPEYGIKPDPAKHQRLVEKAERLAS